MPPIMFFVFCKSRIIHSDVELSYQSTKGSETKRLFNAGKEYSSISHLMRSRVWRDFGCIIYQHTQVVRMKTCNFFLFLLPNKFQNWSNVFAFDYFHAKYHSRQNKLLVVFKYRNTFVAGCDSARGHGNVKSGENLNQQNICRP